MKLQELHDMKLDKFITSATLENLYGNSMKIVFEGDITESDFSHSTHSNAVHLQISGRQQHALQTWIRKFDLTQTSNSTLSNCIDLLLTIR